MTLRGYIGTFLDQGTEEPEWFIFQDASFITNLETGWL